MFKKTQGGSGFKSGKLSSGDAEKKEILEELGYTFDSVTKKSGWRWSSAVSGSDQNLSGEGDAIADAWGDAAARTQAVMHIPAEIWERMSTREQAELIREALPGQ